MGEVPLLLILNRMCRAQLSDFFAQCIPKI